MPYDNLFPDPPIFSTEDIEKCRESGDFCPILFEWYKYVGIITSLVACIKKSSPAARSIQSIHHGVLIGLLNRCSRLMLANVALSHQGLFGETTSIIDRCIFESTVKVIWLCEQGSDDAFTRFIAEGLKSELELKSEIQKRIEARENKILKIEKRMLESIKRYIKMSGLSDSEIETSKKLPDMASLIESIGKERLAYVVGQRIGSHHIHGTWSSLILHYLNCDDDGTFRPRDHDCSTHVNQYIFLPLMVLSGLKAYCNYIMAEPKYAQPLVDFFQSIEKEIVQITKELVGSDFELA